jgi:hypothetical protein
MREKEKLLELKKKLQEQHDNLKKLENHMYVFRAPRFLPFLSRPPLCLYYIQNPYTFYGALFKLPRDIANHISFPPVPSLRGRATSRNKYTSLKLHFVSGLLAQAFLGTTYNTMEPLWSSLSLLCYFTGQTLMLLNHFSARY